MEWIKSTDQPCPKDKDVFVRWNEKTLEYIECKYQYIEAGNAFDSRSVTHWCAVKHPD